MKKSKSKTTAAPALDPAVVKLVGDLEGRVKASQSAMDEVVELNKSITARNEMLAQEVSALQNRLDRNQVHRVAQGLEPNQLRAFLSPGEGVLDSRTGKYEPPTLTGRLTTSVGFLRIEGTFAGAVVNQTVPFRATVGVSKGGKYWLLGNLTSDGTDEVTLVKVNASSTSKDFVEREDGSQKPITR